MLKEGEMLPRDKNYDQHIAVHNHQGHVMLHVGAALSLAGLVSLIATSIPKLSSLLLALAGPAYIVVAHAGWSLRSIRAGMRFMSYHARASDGVQVGKPAVDGTVYTLDGEKTTLLSDSNPNTPHVLSFSCLTCPIYRESAKYWIELVRDAGDAIQATTVYTTEIHPNDGWVVKENDEEPFNFAQPMTLEKRLIPARQLSKLYFVDEPSTHTTVVDDMDNILSDAFHSVPNLLVVVVNGKVVFRSKQGPDGYLLNELRDFLNSM